jgi:hypothetical protein
VPEFQALSAYVSLILSMPCVGGLTETTLAVELPYISPGVRANMADFFIIYDTPSTDAQTVDRRKCGHFLVAYQKESSKQHDREFFPIGAR